MRNDKYPLNYKVHLTEDKIGYLGNLSTILEGMELSYISHAERDRFIGILNVLCNTATPIKKVRIME